MRRGQALVLAALGMVLLVLMVCMTLSFGSRAKAKMETQIVADKGAFSTATAVARTYNVLSLTNRVMIAHMTAMLGIQSAISFSSIWYSIVAQLFIYYPLEMANQLTMCNPCPFCPMCPMANFVVAFILIPRWFLTIAELARVFGAYGGLDMAAAMQARNTGTAAMMLYIGQLEAVSNRLYNAVNNQGVAQRVLTKSAATMQLDTGADTVAKREVGFVAGPLAFGVGAINQTNLILSDRHAVMSAMGARGHPFTANRSSFSLLPNGVMPMLAQAYARAGATGDVRYFNMGNAYFGNIGVGNMVLHQNTMFSTSSTLAVSDDHFMGVPPSFIRYSGPTATGPLTWPLFPVALVSSNNAVGFHMGGIGFAIQIPVGPNLVPTPVIVLLPLTPVIHMTHTLTTMCVLNCPSAWSNFVDYNPLKPFFDDDNFGQPKTPVTVYKDAALAPKDPFNLMFNFRFTSGANFNLQNGSQGSGGVGGAIQIRDGAGAADISRQMGYSTGITYYHRAGHWKEPPNLFNAYWRGSITRADTDRRYNGSDIETTLNQAGANWAARSFTSLRAVGFKGTP